MTDILSQLPELKWRGIIVPCQANSVSFEHAQAKHKQHGVDGAHIEALGRDPAKFSFRIPFRTGLAGYPDLYPTTFRNFWNACLDSSMGVLSHPEFGDIDCKVVSFSLHVDPNVRNGYDVDVVWIETTEYGKSLLDSKGQNLSSAKAYAKSIDETTINPITVPDDLKYMFTKSGKPTTSFQGLVGQLQTLIDTPNRLASAVEAQIDSIVNASNSLIDTLNQVRDPNAILDMITCKRLVSFMFDMKEKSILNLDKRRIAWVTANNLMGVSEAASAAGMGYEEFLKLNAHLGRDPLIQPGTEYYIYVG